MQQHRINSKISYVKLARRSEHLFFTPPVSTILHAPPTQGPKSLARHPLPPPSTHPHMDSTYMRYTAGKGAPP